MARIVLATINARYIHASFGLRYIYANLGNLKKECEILEYEITDRPADICEEILAKRPEVIGLGVYIWNAVQSLEVVRLLKQIAPEVRIVIGGPEVSHEIEEQEICKIADHIIAGEGDIAFKRLCDDIFAANSDIPKIIHADLPDVNNLELPYHYYTDHDLATRVVYVEASRGCPFSCEFCLSSLEVPVRQFNIEQLKPQLEELLRRGLKQFKFVDRTFNLKIKFSKAILDFFLENYQPGLFVHFEMIPDRLPDELKDSIAKFPKGALQFEVGIQTFNPEVSKLISRRQDYIKLEENLRWLKENTGVHVHADLIAGLPGETVESFAEGFNRLFKIGPQEIQFGILKRLRGTPISRHTSEWGMVYNINPPYEILCNKLIDFATMQRLKRFARYWDLVSNSGNFTIARDALFRGQASPFNIFMDFSEWLYKESNATSGIALKRLGEFLFRYLNEKLSYSADDAWHIVQQDFIRCGRSDLPRPDDLNSKIQSQQGRRVLRQERH